MSYDFNGAADAASGAAATIVATARTNRNVFFILSSPSQGPWSLVLSLAPPLPGTNEWSAGERTGTRPGTVHERRRSRREQWSERGQAETRARGTIGDMGEAVPGASPPLLGHSRPFPI